MSKTVGSLPSLVQGVSEQEPHNRAPGQMWESVNMIDSPTKGKARRRGTVYSHHVELPSAIAEALVEARSHTEYTFIIDGKEYSLIYRSRASTLGKDYFAQLLDKDTGQFYDIVYENSTWVDNLIAGGVSAVACIGRYVYLAGNTTLPRATSTEAWNSPANLQKLSAWVREGAYSRKFTVVLYHVNGTKQEFAYTTLAAAYPELLDTSDIPFYKPNTNPQEVDPEYQKRVNDRVNAYEGEKSAWIRKAAEDIVPANIARKLAELISTAGIAASSLGPCVVVDDPNYNDIRLLDDGSNTLVSYAGKEVSDPQFVTLYHWAGKVVRVRPSGGGDKESYYLKAVALDSTATGWTKVEWVEAAGVVHEIHNVVSQLVIDPALKTAYVAQDGAGLKSLAPQLGDHPLYKGNVVGDAITAPLPHYFGRVISCMTVFQDRLMICADNIVNFSRSSDYLNFFRVTVLNIQDNDPIEIFAHGSEGDTIKRAVMFERDMVLFGELRQYAINGREFLSPTNPNINVIGNFEGGVRAQPIASGNFLFFGKHANERTGLHQMQPGETAQTTVVYDVSQVLDTYIAGEPVQLLGTTMPNMITYRTDADPSIWYTYRYADEQGTGRVMSSWGKQQYAPELGTVAAITHYRGDLYVITLRSAGGKDYWFADKLSLNVDLARYPHLDSQVRYGQETPWHVAARSSLYVAADKSSDYFLLGAKREAAEDFIEQAPGVESALVVGSVSPAYFQPTNPYMRDSQGQPILNGRITLASYGFHLADTGGMRAYVLKPDRERTLLFEGRVIGNTSNIIGRQPVYSGIRTVSVGRETRTCIIELRSEDWQPLRVTGAEWSGQVFMPRARGLY
ncbi:tail protein [Xylella phage Paz]|uniref:Tail tubular protein B n=1 Tax=Xylella phage Paz TaxID=1415145 RepID=V5Q7L2_9CAUD|nr:tail protein [Xylella phage Paz]AHB12132.1 tail tubular protein B [Xylella phage Paz]